MKKQFGDYTLLAGSHGWRGSLWQGPDHLLVIEGRGFVLAMSEVYRRMDYASIQSLTLSPTRTYGWMAALMGAGALIFGLLTLAVLDREPFLPITLGLPAGLLLILLVVHLVRGPTCACTLQTAVQVLRLRPLNRRNTAGPVLLQLEALCQQYQSDLPPPDLKADPVGIQPMMMPAAAQVTPLAAMAGAKRPWAGSMWVMVSGLLSVLAGVLLAGELFVSNEYYTVFNVFLGVCSAVMLLIALVRAYRRQVPGPLAGALWTGLVGHLLGAAAMYALTVAAALARTRGNVTPSEFIESNREANRSILENMPAFSFEQTQGWGWGIVTLGLVLVFCGVLELIYSPARDVQETAAPPSMPPLPPPPPPPA